MKSSSWFEKSTEYWKDVTPDVQGMLGGYESLAIVDERDSLEFLKKNIPLGSRNLVLDCGAGIGRVSKNVLLKIFEKVSILECVESFVLKARDILPNHQVYHFHVKTIQQMTPLDDEKCTYDLIWFQWVLCYADDLALINILNEAKNYLKRDGFIGIKENISSNTSEVIDDIDHSVIRTDLQFKNIFIKAGFVPIAIARQKNFPPTLYPVKMYLFKPVDSSDP